MWNILTRCYAKSLSPGQSRVSGNENELENNKRQARRRLGPWFWGREKLCFRVESSREKSFFVLGKTIQTSFSVSHFCEAHEEEGKRGKNKQSGQGRGSITVWELWLAFSPTSLATLLLTALVEVWLAYTDHEPWHDMPDGCNNGALVSPGDNTSANLITPGTAGFLLTD